MSHWGSYSLIVLHCSSSEKISCFDYIPICILAALFWLVILVHSLPGVRRLMQAWHGRRLSACEIPARWIFPCRRQSHEPSFGVHECSCRPAASVKSVSSVALWVADPNPTPHPKNHQTAPLYHHIPTPYMSSSTRHFFPSALRQSEPMSECICSTRLQPSIRPADGLGSLLADWLA